VEGVTTIILSELSLNVFGKRVGYSKRRPRRREGCFDTVRKLEKVIFHLETMITIQIPIKVVLGVNVVREVEVIENSGKAAELINEVSEKLKREVEVDNLREHPVVRAYRDFYWRIGIDPTKQRPSGEALVRRALRGSIPRINNVVDAGNIASMETFVPIGLYDLDRVSGELKLRFAAEGEIFRPIGGKDDRLEKNQIVLADEEKVLHVFPYRDSRETMIRKETRNVLVVACGVPGVEKAIVETACKKASQYIVMLAGGIADECKIIY
jgi:DNA/RNA-binding domain of Phe-tRNA-synthetase-like protein